MNGYKSKCISHRKCDIHAASHRKRNWVVSCLFTLVTMVLGGLCVWAIFPHKVARLRSKIEHSVKMIEVRRHLPEVMKNVESPLLIACGNECSYKNPEFWIAHGGGIGEFVHTNCLEAVQDSLKRGFRFIELDLLETRDNHLVGGHSWKELRAITGSDVVSEARMSKADIVALRAKWKKTPLFAEDICQLLRDNPNMILVTDKTQNFELLMREIPYPDQMVLEAFDFPAYLQAIRAGFRNVALSAGSLDSLLKALQYRIPGIVIDSSLLETTPEIFELVKQLHQNGCCITVFYSKVSDKSEYIYRHLGKNISRIYTDTWSPSAPPPQP